MPDTLTTTPWAGFASIGERVERSGFGIPPHISGWYYQCDGMPTLAGCSSSTIVTRRWSRTGTKSTGWLVTYGLGENDVEDHDVVLTFCPDCAAVVAEQEKARRA